MGNDDIWDEPTRLEVLEAENDELCNRVFHLERVLLYLMGSTENPLVTKVLDTEYAYEAIELMSDHIEDEEDELDAVARVEFEQEIKDWTTNWKDDDDLKN